MNSNAAGPALRRSLKAISKERSAGKAPPVSQDAVKGKGAERVAAKVSATKESPRIASTREGSTSTKVKKARASASAVKAKRGKRSTGMSSKQSKGGSAANLASLLSPERLHAFVSQNHKLAAAIAVIAVLTAFSYIPTDNMDVDLDNDGFFDSPLSRADAPHGQLDRGGRDDASSHAGTTSFPTHSSDAQQTDPLAMYRQPLDEDSDPFSEASIARHGGVVIDGYRIADGLFENFIGAIADEQVSSGVPVVADDTNSTAFAHSGRVSVDPAQIGPVDFTSRRGREGEIKRCLARYARDSIYNTQSPANIHSGYGTGVVSSALNDAADSNAIMPPLDKQGVPVPRAAAPLAAMHEALRVEAETMPLTQELRDEMEAGYRVHRFEQFISDRIPLDRHFPDYRHPECTNQRYFPRFELPTTTVILIFHNEALSTLARTAMSVIRNSPPELLTEILLVDDDSDVEWLGDDLDHVASLLPKTRIIRLRERHGLIKAKIAGAREALGDTITFLDSHCECNAGWLEPLLDRVRRNKYTVAVPAIDTIEFTNFAYSPTSDPSTRGVFTWRMQFSWKPLTQEQRHARASAVEPIRSPAMAGGLFTMDREAFFELGTYDEGLKIWGGENLEMSFRIWMCGGSIETVPCSRVGHVFRDVNPVNFEKFDFSAKTTITRNLRRVSDVWMDGYGKLYEKLGRASGDKFKSDTASRTALRKDLNCKSFQWYLDNVFPDMFVPHEDTTIAAGALYNYKARACADVGHRRYDDMIDPNMRQCVIDEDQRLKAEQQWYFAKNSATIRHIAEFGDRCLYLSSRNAVKMAECDQERPDMSWEFINEGKQLQHQQSGLCLTASFSATKNIYRMRAAECDAEDEAQHWGFLWDNDQSPATPAADGQTLASQTNVEDASEEGDGYDDSDASEEGDDVAAADDRWEEERDRALRARALMTDADEEEYQRKLAEHFRKQKELFYANQRQQQEITN